MHTIESALKAHIHNPSVFFVFPTDIAASCWSDYALRFTKAVALERFSAWDRFKSEAVRAAHQEKNSIPSALRKLFALRLLERNAAEPFFSSLVPPEYAASALSFADWVSSLLPLLALWKKKRSFSSAPCDAEDADLYELEKQYRTFLDKNALFEPAWEMPPFCDEGKTYIIVYPEILQDFEEYRALLEQSGHVTFIHVPDIPLDSQHCRFFSYSNTRTELREIALYIRSLCDPSAGKKTGESAVQARFEWTDIAVSVPDAENLMPYVMREFGLYNIPVQLRSGKILSRYPAGNLFSLIQNCDADSFSFTAVRDLLTDSAFPWKDEEAINQLISFGIKNNCVCSYDGIDVWEQAFAKSGHEERALTLYRRLKKHVKAMADAAGFQKLREQYFAFRSAFFNPELFTEENNRIISRCISELGALADIELSYPDAARCSKPLAFFVSVLDSKEYLAQSATRGVSVFSYKVASCAPFKQHIILNASQDALNVVYRPLSFLADPKRFDLHISDTDVSDIFARLYAFHSEHTLRVSCARKSFSGYTIAHNVFNACEISAAGKTQKNALNGENGVLYSDYYPDYFAAEKAFWRTDASLPPRLHSIQKKGFKAWTASRSVSPPLQEGGRAKKTALSLSSVSPLSSLPPLSADFIKKRILQYALDADTGKIKVSPSALKSFYTCPQQWLFSRVLRIEEYRAQAAVSDDVFIGILYHEIIKRVLNRLKETDSPLVLENEKLPKTHEEYIRFFTREVIEHLPESCALQTDLSALTVENFRTQENQIIRILTDFFYEFTLWFSGCRILSAEESLSLENEGWILKGTIDCVLGSVVSDSVYIVDFKTSGVPKFADCIKLPQRELADFQLASYISLYEGVKCASRPWVSAAAFFSIHNKELTSIVGRIVSPVTGKKKPHFDKDVLERCGIYADGISSVDETLKELKNAAGVYAASLTSACVPLFTDPECSGRFPDGSAVPYSTCASCAYKTLCRTTYVLGRKR
ncbi:PD-(D/E)XK nuclease family protein [Treponema sp. OMZ 840]|uniref:PD-(D/E)XK nuclease family protein n=1 Tax=Treponema sp. OMZ 840 TaxID=244313 RepID=UPI003D8EE5D7